MSLLGKILVVFNLLGAAGLVYVATTDYAKRQAWAHNYVRAKLLLTGLPLDEKELDDSNQPAIERLSENDYTEMFRAVGGRPVDTQAKEFDVVRDQVSRILASVEANPVQHANVLAKFLLPFTDSYLEREFLISARDNTDTEQAFQELRARCQEAFRQATNPQAPEGMVHQSFRTAFHSLPGAPAELFVTKLLNLIPQQRQQAASVNVDLLFNQVANQQLSEMKIRFESIVSEAAGQSPDPNEARKTPDSEIRKAAIARFLFGVAPTLAGLEIASDSGSANDKQLVQVATPSEYQKRLVMTETFKQRIDRMLVVCGMRSTLVAIGDRTAGLRRMNDYARNVSAEERQHFVNDYRFRLERIREMAGQVKGEQHLRTENQERLLGYDTVSKERRAEIKQLQEEYNALRSSTASETSRLRELSQELLDLRSKIHDAIAANEDGEERIRSLEQQIRRLDDSKDN